MCMPVSEPFHFPAAASMPSCWRLRNPTCHLLRARHLLQPQVAASQGSCPREFCYPRNSAGFCVSGSNCSLSCHLSCVLPQGQSLRLFSSVIMLGPAWCSTNSGALRRACGVNSRVCLCASDRSEWTGHRGSREGR